jgi:hypothetical protein
MSSRNNFLAFTARLRDFMASASSESTFNELAHELFSLQRQHNLPYKAFCEARGVSPKTIRTWQQIPAVPASAFKEFELSCLPPEERTSVFHSSGTTGESRSRHFHNQESLAIYGESVLRWFEPNVLQSKSPKRRVLCLTPPPSAAPHSSLVHMFELVRREFGGADSAFLGRLNHSGDWQIDFAKAVTVLEQAMEQRLLLLGTAFNFVHLLDYLAEQKLRYRLSPGSTVMETGGYKGRSRALDKEQLHALLAQFLGIAPQNIVCEYGMSELSSQAYDSLTGAGPLEHATPVRKFATQERRFRFPHWARCRIISPESGQEVLLGQTGLIQVFDLANVYSVLAIQTEDLATRWREGFEIQGRAALAEPRGCSLIAV